MEGIQVSTETAGSRNQISIIRVGGYIDTTTSSEVERALMALLKQGRYKIIIDLGNVDYISSAGWGIFISEIKSIRENGGDLKLVRMIPDVYEIFELLEFHHILDVYDSVEGAVQKFEEMEYATVESGTDRRQEARGESATSGPTAAQPTGVSASGRETEAVSPEPRSETPVSGERPPAEETTRKVDLINLPVEEKIKYIVARNPNLGAYKINKILNSPDFGFTKIGWFGVRAILSRLGLNSRKNRKRFSETFRHEHGLL